MEKVKPWLKDHWKDLLKWLAVLAMIIAVLVNYDSLKNLDIRAMINSAPNPWVAVLIIFGLYLAKGFVLVIPSSVLYVSVGLAYPAVPAIIINFIGLAIELAATYLMGLFLGGDYVRNMLDKNEKMKKIIGDETKSEWAIICILRLIAAPIVLTSLFYGSKKTNFFKYLSASLVGLGPRVVFFSVVGDAAYNILPTLGQLFGG